MLTRSPRARCTASVLAVCALSGLLLAGCAAGPNNVATVDTTGDLAGFWLGLWHGLILPITFVISLFTENVSIYEVHR